jgi:hypothetical protein
MKCCNKNHETKFCPVCGRCLSNDPLCQLMAHITGQTQSFKSQIKNCDPEYSSNLARLKRHYNKWKEWEEALRKLILEKKD